MVDINAWLAAMDTRSAPASMPNLRRLKRQPSTMTGSKSKKKKSEVTDETGETGETTVTREDTPQSSQPTGSDRTAHLAMTFLDMPVILHNTMEGCPSAISDLRKEVTRFRVGIYGVISPAGLDTLRQRFPQEAESLWDGLAINTARRLELGTEVDENMLEFLFQSLEAHTGTDDSEASWNDGHHYPLLFISKLASVHAADTLVQSVTRTQLEPIFKPINPDTGAALAGKCVDYAICLRGGTALMRRAEEKLHAAFRDRTRSRTVNFFESAKLHLSPIAISVETKAPQSACTPLQLQVWVYAHFKLLTELVRFVGWEDRALPVLPLVLARGSMWQLYIAACEKDESTRYGWKVHMYDLGAFAAISGLEGMLKGIAVLLLLIDHVQTEYKPWLESLFQCIIEKEGSGWGGSTM